MSKSIAAGSDTTEQAAPTLAHIVTATADEITAARLNGTELTARCGHVWVPTKPNPRDFPTCTVCVLTLIRSDPSPGCTIPGWA